MNENELRLLMIENKAFLKKIFLTKNLKTLKSLILSSSVNEIDLLLNILFCITDGRIPIKKVNFEILKKKKKIIILHKNFQSPEKFRKLLSSQLKEKITILIKFLPVYSNLLYSLFYNG